MEYSFIGCACARARGFSPLLRPHFMPWFIVFRSPFTFNRKPIPIQWTKQQYAPNERTKKTLKFLKCAKKIEMRERKSSSSKAEKKSIFHEILPRKYLQLRRNIEIHIRSWYVECIVCTKIFFTRNHTPRAPAEKYRKTSFDKALGLNSQTCHVWPRLHLRNKRANVLFAAFFFVSFSVWYELLTHKINHIPNKSKRKEIRWIGRSAAWPMSHTHRKSCSKEYTERKWHVVFHFGQIPPSPPTSSLPFARLCMRIGVRMFVCLRCLFSSFFARHVLSLEMHTSFRAISI